MICREFFDSVKEELEPCKTLQQYPEPTQVAWEFEIASAHSQSYVQDGEVLARQVVDPTHFDHVTGTIKPNFFDDAASIGASCHRLCYATEQEIFQMTNDRVFLVNQNPPKTGPRTAIGYASIKALEVRSIMTVGNTSRRGAAVYDTAKPNDISHADICQLVSGRQEGRSVRAQLWMLTRDRLVTFSQLPTTTG